MRRVRDSGAAWREVAKLAGAQHGLVSVAQLAALGLDRDARFRAVRSGHLIPHQPGSFFVGHRRTGTDVVLAAAVLRAGRGSVLAGRSSLVFWGLLADERRQLELLTPTQRRAKPGITLARRQFDPRHDVRHRRGIPVLTPLAALADAAGRVAQGQLDAAVNEAAVRRLLHPRAVAELLQRSAGRPGAAQLRAALAALDPAKGRPQSALERRWAQFAREHGLPPYERGTLHLVAGVELTEADVWFPDHWLVVELDSLAFHEHGSRPVRDRRRDRRLLARGIATIRATWPDLDDPALEAELADDVRQALADGALRRRTAAGGTGP